MSFKSDVETLRRLAARYMAITELPVQEEKRTLWREHFSLRHTRVPVLATYGMHNVWCREVFGDEKMECEDLFYRNIERRLRMNIFQHEVVGDDTIQEPWFAIGAALKGGWGGLWGVEERMHASDVEGGAAAFDPPLRDWDDVSKLHMTHHEIDEEATARDVEKLSNAVGDIITIDVQRTPAYIGFMADISTSIAVTPVADVRVCAEQIGADYAISWRPNPTDMVCCGFREGLIRRIIGEGLEACRGGYPHIHLKDVETVEGDVTRLTRWVRLVRDIVEEIW